MSSKIKTAILDYIIIFIGSALFSLAFNLFLQGANIAVGGITGIAMVINYFFPGITMGVLTFLLNIPFCLIGLKEVGGSFMIKTIFAAVSLSVVMGLTEFLPPLTSDPLLCSVFGGIFTGIGLGLVILRNGSTGGSDIIGCVLKKHFSGIPLGKLVLAADVCIVLCACYAFGSVESILYAIIKMYVTSIAMDAVLYGLNFAKVAYIFTDKIDTISKLIIEKLGHGATIINCVGAYTDEPRQMIMCAIEPNQIGQLKTIVREVDPNAFMILTESHEVLGMGFKPNEQKVL